MLDAREAVRRIQDGKILSPREINEIRLRLAEGCEDAEAHNLVRALALSVEPSPADVGLVSKYLNIDDDYAQLGAIYALCSYWDLARSYIPKIIQLSSADGWLEKPDLAYGAIMALGDLFFKHKEKEALRALLSLLDSSSSVHSQDYRRNLLTGIATALHGGVGAFKMGEFHAPTESALLKRAHLVLS